MKRKKILVTGGSGMVGSFLKDIMPDATYISSKNCNLTNQEGVEKMFNHIKPDTVVHLAARVGGITDNINHPAEYFDENILMNTFVLKAAKSVGVKQFIGVLSTCIYPDILPEEQYPLKEECLHLGPPTPTNFSYGYAKRCLAVQIDAYNKEYGTNYNYLIPSNLFGEYDKFDDGSSHYVAALIKKIYNAKKNGEKSIKLMGTGAPIRQFCYSLDFARVIDYCIYNNVCENFNVAGSEAYTIKEIAEIALRACDAQDLILEFDSSKPDGQYRKDVSNKKMLSVMPEFEFTSLEDGIKQTYKKAIELNKF